MPVAGAAEGASPRPNPSAPFDGVISNNARSMVEEGRQIFRFDTFGDEAFWGDTLKLHQAIEGAALRRRRPGRQPEDGARGRPQGRRRRAAGRRSSSGIKAGQVDLDDPATTLALLKLNAVVGVTGFFDDRRQAPTSIGIQCALCHSTVDDSFAPGIGHRLDGWANRDLNVGAIVSLVARSLGRSRACSASTRRPCATVLQRLGPGQVRRRAVPRRQGVPARRQDGGDADPAGLRPGRRQPPHLDRLGLGPVLERLRRVLEMHGKGTFFDPRLDDATQFPVAAKNGFGHVDGRRRRPDHRRSCRRCTSTSSRSRRRRRRRAASTRRPPARGDALFGGKAKCATCHVDAALTEPGWNMHTAAEIGIDDFQANRAPDDRYRTSPLQGLCGRTRRAASITTAGSPRCSTSSTTTTPSSARPQRRGEERPRRVPEVALGTRGPRGFQGERT